MLVFLMCYVAEKLQFLCNFLSVPFIPSFCMALLMMFTSVRRAFLSRVNNIIIYHIAWWQSGPCRFTPSYFCSRYTHTPQLTDLLLYVHFYALRTFYTVMKILILSVIKHHSRPLTSNLIIALARIPYKDLFRLLLSSFGWQTNHANSLKYLTRFSHSRFLNLP